mmetsp:Transcript_23076/g.56924  ORF Transcript_23076/g.56924 Transcript_23076/m.56924 type:complete len:115 (+) Transcript_23076:1121-1465(+)
MVIRSTVMARRLLLFGAHDCAIVRTVSSSTSSSLVLFAETKIALKRNAKTTRKARLLCSILRRFIVHKSLIRFDGEYCSHNGYLLFVEQPAIRHRKDERVKVVLSIGTLIAFDN